MFMVPPECNEKCEAYLGGGRNRTAIFYLLHFASFVQLNSQQQNLNYMRQTHRYQCRITLKHKAVFFIFNFGLKKCSVNT